MADQKIQLTVQVNAETGQLEVLGAKFRETGQKAQEAGKSFGGLAGEAGGLLKSFLPFATAGGIIAFFASAVKGAEEQNEAFRRLQFTMESNGQSWARSRQQVELWAQAVANSTRFSDGEAIEVLDKFTRVTGSLTQAQTAARLSMDLSVASGKPLADTTALITDLLNGNQRALIEVKREFGNAAGAAKTTQEAIDLLSKKYDGAATQSKGLTDSTANLKNKFGQLRETLGNALIPIFIPAIDLIKKMVEGFQLLAIVIGGLVRANIAMLKFDFDGMKKVFDETISNIQDFEQKKTTTLAAGENERLSITKAALDKAKAEKDAADMELEQKQAERQQKVLDAEAHLNQQMAALTNSSLQTKLNALNAEVAMEQEKNAKIARSKIELEKLNAKLGKVQALTAKQLAEEEIFLKQQTAFNIANTAVQTLQTLNSLGEKGSESERVRARALLILQQAIAIGWAWVAAQKASVEVGPGLAYGLAAAQTAMIVANTASQMQAIDRAASQEATGINQIAIRPSVPGIDLGSGGGVVGGGVSNGGGGGGGGGVGGSGGGQPLQFVITFQGDIIINGVSGAAEISDRVVDIIGEKLIEKIKGMGQLSFTGGA